MSKRSKQISRTGNFHRPRSDVQQISIEGINPQEGGGGGLYRHNCMHIENLVKISNR